MKKYRKVEFYKDYFQKFFDSLPFKVQQKFVWTFELIEDIERVPETYLKHVNNGIYEIRVKQGSNIFRTFCFFDNDKLVITINGFRKKTQNTPKNEINKAIKIRNEYEKGK